MQTQTQISPALEELMRLGARSQAPGPGGQPVPTVATQMAMAAEPMAPTPQGISGLLPGANVAAQRSVQAQQPVTQAQLQQAMSQRSQGVAGLPAPNMGFADGGVVGYAGPDGSDVELDVSGRIKKALRDWYERTETDYMQRAGATPEMIAKKLGKEPPVPPTPIPEGSDRRLDIPAGGIVSPGMAQAPAAPSPRPEPRPPALPAPAPTGVAALAERPTYDAASIPAAGTPYMKAGEEDVGRLRKAEGERAAFEKTLPDLSAKGIAALQERMGDISRADQERKERLSLDRVVTQLLGRAQGPGGGARADIQFMATQRAAEDAYSQARLGNQQAQLLLEKAQQERQLGRFDRAIALEREASALMEKARDNALKAQELQQRGVAAQFQGAVEMRGQDVKVSEGALDRASKERIEGERLKQQAEQNGQMQLANRINAANITVSSAIEKMDRDLEKRFGTTIKMYQMMKPEDLQKQPALAAGYQQYMQEREKIYSTSVEPAVRERDRLAAMINSGQDLSKWGEPTVKTGR